MNLRELSDCELRQLWIELFEERKYRKEVFKHNLKMDKIEDISRLRKEGVKYQDIARKYRMSMSRIRQLEKEGETLKRR